jgi:hypothetical protein
MPAATDADIKKLIFGQYKQEHLMSLRQNSSNAKNVKKYGEIIVDYINKVGLYYTILCNY